MPQQDCFKSLVVLRHNRNCLMICLQRRGYLSLVYDQNFYWGGGGGGWVDGEGDSSERCLKWGGGGH